MANPSDEVRVSRLMKTVLEEKSSLIIVIITQAKIPIGRLGKPAEIASIVAMLATNGYMTNKVGFLVLILAIDGSIMSQGHHSRWRLDERRYLRGIQNRGWITSRVTATSWYCDKIYKYPRE